MYKIIINDEINTLGLITFQITNQGGTLITEGLLKTHLYVEEITSLECDRFKLDGIEVYTEAFGSTDIFNLYKFTFTEFLIKELGENLEEDYLISLYDKELE